MSGAELRFTYIESTWAVAFLVLLAAALAAAIYLRAFRGGITWPPLLLGALRFLAIVTALLLLLRPILRFQVFQQREERLVVLLDTSRSMAVADSVGGKARLDSALDVVGSEALAKLARLFRVELHRFSGPDTLLPISLRVADAGNRDAVQADGFLTDLEAAWSAVDGGTGPLAGLLVLSDGRDHGQLARGDATGPVSPRLPSVPVYAVGLGSGEPEPVDLAWVKIGAERQVLVGSRVDVRAGVAFRGMPLARTDLVVRLDGEEIERRPVELAAGTREIRFEVTPRRAGRHIYELLLEPLEAETMDENNRTYLVLEVTDRPLQVLFFDGRARWQYKFVRRGLSRDPRVNVTGLVRLSDERLLQQGRAPVNLDSGLPSTRQDWKAIDVLVLGNVVAEDLPPALQETIVAWVGEDGGGLIYSGGAESHRALRGTPLGDLLPVDPGAGRRLDGPLVVLPELAALEHPVTRGLLRRFAAVGESGPLSLGEAFEAGEARPGSEVLVSVRATPAGEAGEEGNAPAPSSGGRRLPLLAVRQHGAGRVIAWFTESDWRWVMNRPGGEGERVFNLLWGRMARWAARRDESGPGESMEVSRSEVRVGEEVTVEISGDADAGSALLTITDPRGGEAILPDAAEGGRRVARFTPRVAGVYRLALARRAGDATIPAGDAVLIARPDSREVENTRPDWDLLRDLAARTGGEFLTLADSGTLAARILRDRPGLVSDVELGTERSWTLYLALVLFLTLEWTLRRKIFAI